MSQDGVFVRVERAGAVSTLLIDRPPHNFIDTRLARQLHAAVRTTSADHSVRVIVLRSAVEARFIGHVDVHEVVAQLAASPRGLTVRQASAALRVAALAIRLLPRARWLDDGPLAGLVQLLRLHALTLDLATSDKVTIAVIEGDALGPACDLALACDLRLMTTGDHHIGSPELTIGGIPGLGGAHRMARILGPALAFEDLLMGRVFSPEEAHARGLVHAVADPEALNDHLARLTELAARRAPAAIQGLKRAVYEASALHPRRALALERALFMAAASRDELRSAMDLYRAELDRLGGVPPWSVPDELTRWQAGLAPANSNEKEDPWVSTSQPT